MDEKQGLIIGEIVFRKNKYVFTFFIDIDSAQIIQIHPRGSQSYLGKSTELGFILSGAIYWIIIKILHTACSKYKARIEIILWTHKRHPIAHPDGWAMGCLLWVFGRKFMIILHCITAQQHMEPGHQQTWHWLKYCVFSMGCSHVIPKVNDQNCHWTVLSFVLCTKGIKFLSIFFEESGNSKPRSCDYKKTSVTGRQQDTVTLNSLAPGRFYDISDE